MEATQMIRFNSITAFVFAFLILALGLFSRAQINFAGPVALAFVWIGKLGFYFVQKLDAQETRIRQLEETIRGSNETAPAITPGAIEAKT